MERRIRIGRTVTRVFALVMLAATSPAVALNIALSNDDGWDAPGIQAMKVALESGG